MLVLFLVLSYFILIFNILVPGVLEKLRVEHRAFVNFANNGGDGSVCADGRVVRFVFGPTGLRAVRPVDARGVPLPCSAAVEGGARTIGCGPDCLRAYEELFLAL
ncbi:ORF183 [Saltwater crocodilepox virus]|nr:ORF183 [Saltwater crocodilepox virus]QGT48550.1 ORF183 [Saltwater crocodilepox virus]QGT48764.1 ORF183 [Saltwater crocodilepox virus]QGT48976.1 ORF183 [Saltwater crocodilepox virus]QGT49189.1 ORF183 [Saltwater crocodilepox virus]